VAAGSYGAGAFNTHDRLSALSSDSMLSSSATRASSEQHYGDQENDEEKHRVLHLGESNLPAICGARCDVPPTEIGIAMGKAMSAVVLRNRPVLKPVAMATSDPR